MQYAEKGFNRSQEESAAVGRVEGDETPEGEKTMAEEGLSRDREILHAVTREAADAAGSRIDVAVVVDMLRLLEQKFGNEFRLEGAYIALTRLRETADMMEKELRKASEAKT